MVLPSHNKGRTVDAEYGEKTELFFWLAKLVLLLLFWIRRLPILLLHRTNKWLTTPTNNYMGQSHPRKKVTKMLDQEKHLNLQTFFHTMYNTTAKTVTDSIPSTTPSFITS